MCPQSGSCKSTLIIYFISLLFVIPIITAGLANAEVAGPGWITQTAPLVSPEDTALYYNSSVLTPAATVQTQSASTITQASIATVYDPEIVELARALQNDAVLIYEYVLNHIDYIPYYGHLKGQRSITDAV